MNPIVIVLYVLYILSPIDLLPEVIPFLGWLDDVGVLAYLGYSFTTVKQIKE